MNDQQSALPATRQHDIIDMIRSLRNDRIKNFLNEQNLRAYLSERFTVTELSASKTETITNGLRDLLIAPVNTRLYRPIMQAYKTMGDVCLLEENEKLFYSEIDVTLKKLLL